MKSDEENLKFFYCDVVLNENELFKIKSFENSRFKIDKIDKFVIKIHKTIKISIKLYKV